MVWGVDYRLHSPESNPARAMMILEFFPLNYWRDLDFHEHFIKRHRNFMLEKGNVLREPLRGKCQFGVWRWVLTSRIWARSVIQMSVELSMSERASKLNMQQTSNWTRPLWSRNLRLRPSASSWAWESPWWKTRKLALTVAAKTTCKGSQ